MTRDRFLALLRILETDTEHDPVCPICGYDALISPIYEVVGQEHHKTCELKAAIDWLDKLPSGDVAIWYNGRIWLLSGPEPEPVR